MTSIAVLKAARIAYNKSVGGSASPVKMKPGTYIGSARGNSSVGELAVNVTVSEDKILSIERWDKIDTYETEVIVNAVFDRMVPRMIEHQSLLVDSVCGATGPVQQSGTPQRPLLMWLLLPVVPMNGLF
jgi:fumarate reductase flavoprotein subunit